MLFTVTVAGENNSEGQGQSECSSEGSHFEKNLQGQTTIHVTPGENPDTKNLKYSYVYSKYNNDTICCSVFQWMNWLNYLILNYLFYDGVAPCDVFNSMSLLNIWTLCCKVRL